MSGDVRARFLTFSGGVSLLVMVTAFRRPNGTTRIYTRTSSRSIGSRVLLEARL
jgi:hypothetical protein